MSGAPYTLMLLVPSTHAALPPVDVNLRWSQVPDEDTVNVWALHPASCTAAELDGWHRAARLGEDVPLVQVERLLSDQQHVPLAHHTLLRLSLSTSLRRTVQGAPRGWEVARQVVGLLNVTFAWSASEESLDDLWAGGSLPWTRVWPTLIFHEAFLQKLRLDPLNLDDIAGGGDVFRFQRLPSHWLLQAPEGLGNESAALLEGGAVNDALEAALQRVSIQHDQEVQRWLQGALPVESARPEGHSLG